jgi:superfamily II DNA or RNA helicase
LDDDPDGDDDREATLDDWICELSEIMKRHSRQIVKQGSNLRCSFEDVGFDKTGQVWGKCLVPEDVLVYDVSLDVGLFGERFSWGCSCPQSANRKECPHVVHFTKYLLTELVDSNSRLQARLAAEIGDETTIVRTNALSVPRLDPISQVLDELDQYLENRPPAGDERMDSAKEEAPVRLAWRLETSSNGIDLVPLKQRGKKRGGGWTKGQRLALASLYHTRDELIHTAADERVVSAIRQPAGFGYYYQPTLVINLVDAVNALVGHDAVYLNDHPAEVRRFAFGIRVIERPEGLMLGIAIPELEQSKRPIRLAIYSDGIVAYPDGQPLIFVCRCDASQVNLARAVLKLPSFPRDRLDVLRERLEKIRETTPVELPPSLAGRFVPAETTPVVLLRSNRQGSLECGMWVKDARGQMFLPGEGGLVHPDAIDGQPVQRRRDPQAETLRAREIVRGLQLDRALPLSEWKWRIVEFEQSLRLLEDLETQAKAYQFEVAWDPKSVQAVRIVGSVTPQNLRVEVSRKKDWFGINGRCQVGDHEFQLADLLNAARSEPAPGYMEIQPGQWARITAELREKLKQLRDVAHRNRKELEISAVAAPILRDLLEAQIDFEAPKAWQECVTRLDRSQQLDPHLPQSFVGSLRDYQLDGYRWLRRLAEWGVGGCLADDMGLGKTIQALAVLIDRQQTGPALVIAPTSVGFNWVREAQRFAPGLNAHLYRETDRDEFLENVGPGDLVICSYGLSLRDEAKLAGVHWGTLILDEAQFIKNSRTKTSQAIRGFQAGWTLALTGTPMENHLGELWGIFRNVSPGLFGSWDNFRDRFAGPIEKDNDAERRLALSRVIRPFVLRRTKSEVLQELPDRTEMNLYVELSDQERRRYNEMRLAALGEIDQIVGLPDTQDQRFRILAIMTRLRQLACHVGLVDQSWEGTSAKLALLVETMQELKDEGHRALVFSQFTSYLALIRQALENAGITYQYLDGSTPAKARQERVDAFQAGESDAFLISLKAGGTGLNLTAADYVIHMDPWWNPAVEDQATDRAHRIGQTRPVMVYRIVARGTIEEQILDLHSDKRELVAGVMEGTQSAGRLATDELISLIRGVS